MVCVIVNFFSANKTGIQMVNILIMTCLFAALMRTIHYKIFRALPLATGLPNANCRQPGGLPDNFYNKLYN